MIESQLNKEKIKMIEILDGPKKGLKYPAPLFKPEHTNEIIIKSESHQAYLFYTVDLETFTARYKCANDFETGKLVELK